MALFKDRVVELMPGSPEAKPVSYVKLKVPPLGRRNGGLFSPTGL